MLDDTKRLKLKNGFDANLVYGSRKFIFDTSRDKIIKKSVAQAHNVVIKLPKGVYLRQEKHFVKQTKCPLCNGKKFKFLLERMGISISYCSECDFGFQNPKLKKQTLDSLYKYDRIAYNKYSSKAQLLIDLKRYDYGLELLDAIKVSSKNLLLDIGCGNGLSLERAVKKGWKNCLGIDPNRKYQILTDNRIKIIHASFENAFEQIKEKADAIMLWDMLEHIYEPKIFLPKLKNVMNDKALLLIMVPNLKSLATRLIREKSPTFSWEHLSYFTARSLKTLLESSGFSIELMETVISEIGNINNYLSLAEPYFGENEKTITLDFLTPAYIHKHMLGSRIFVIARKKA